MTDPNPSPELRAAVEKLTRPIIGMENRTPLEVRDILFDRIRSHFAALSQTLPAPGEVELAGHVRGIAQVIRAFPNDEAWGGPDMAQQAAAILDRAVASLATVAAANDEGVARSSNDDPVGALAIRLAATANEAEEEHGEWTWREIADAAIRLLSQGGGKA